MNHQIAAQAVDSRGGADIGDSSGQPFIKLYLGQILGGLADAPGLFPFARLPIPPETSRVALEGQTPPDDLVAQLRVTQRQDFRGDAEAIEQLRTQLPFL